ncbi:MAG TPA: ABC transporter ATP-binding protein [Methanocella sp.]|jgi:molybdate transport system ATP-binding protein
MIRIRVRKKLRDFTLDVNLTASDGETVVLLGSNGSGKTTVLNMVAGLLSPDEGAIEIGGRTLFSSGTRIDIPPEQRDIGYVFQHYALFPHMTVYDNVAFGLRMRKAPAEVLESRVREELESLGLWEFRKAPASKLSGGQRQKVALARSLVVEPALLLLDEPLSALDTRSHSLMREVLRERIKRSGIPCIIVLHSLRDALELGDRVCVMETGQVTLSGKPAEILREGRDRFVDNLFL